VQPAFCVVGASAKFSARYPEPGDGVQALMPDGGLRGAGVRVLDQFGCGRRQRLPGCRHRDPAAAGDPRAGLDLSHHVPGQENQFSRVASSPAPRNPFRPRLFCISLRARQMSGTVPPGIGPTVIGALLS